MSSAWSSHWSISASHRTISPVSGFGGSSSRSSTSTARCCATTRSIARAASAGRSRPGSTVSAAFALSSRQIRLAARYKGIELPESYRIDLIVEDLVIVEVKAIEKLAAIHEVQLLTYLRFANKRLGLLLNFHVGAMRQGVRRVVNNL